MALFRSLCLFITVTFAALSVCGPVTSTPDVASKVVERLPFPVKAGYRFFPAARRAEGLNPLSRAAVERALAGFPKVEARASSQTLPEIVVGLKTKLAPAVKSLESAAKLKKTADGDGPDDEFDIALVLFWFEEIQIHCLESLDAIRYLFESPFEGFLGYNGNTLSLLEFAYLVSDLFESVYNPFYDVWRLLDIGYDGLIFPHFNGISIIFADMLEIVFGRIGGFRVILIPVFGNLIPIFRTLRLMELLAVLGF